MKDASQMHLFMDKLHFKNGVLCQRHNVTISTQKYVCNFEEKNSHFQNFLLMRIVCRGVSIEQRGPIPSTVGNSPGCSWLTQRAAELILTHLLFIYPYSFNYYLFINCIYLFNHLSIYSFTYKFSYLYWPLCGTP